MITMKKMVKEKKIFKKLFLAGLITGCMALFCACGSDSDADADLGEEFTQEVNNLKGVELSVDIVSPTGITFTISNQTEQDYSYGQNYFLQQESRGHWYMVEEKSPGIATMELLWVTSGSTNTHELGWENSYGSLPAGHYRIVKSVADSTQGYYIAGEFRID